MERVRLVHWREAEARERVRELRTAGFRVEYDEDSRAALTGSKEDPPDAFVIDLTRLPSHGREWAWALRKSKKTRAVPLVFVGGDPAKVARLREELPDATYAAWDGVARAIERAMAAPVRDPIVPEQKHFYTQKPLAAKLGMKAGSTLRLVEAPDGFEPLLGELPSGAKLVRGARGAADLVLWFVRSQKELRTALPRWKKAAQSGTRVWVAWPKKTSSIVSDLSEQLVRTAPHALGLVDFKICAIDADWSGMCFALRR